MAGDHTVVAPGGVPHGARPGRRQPLGQLRARHVLLLLPRRHRHQRLRRAVHYQSSGRRPCLLRRAAGQHSTHRITQACGKLVQIAFFSDVPWGCAVALPPSSTCIDLVDGDKTCNFPKITYARMYIGHRLSQIICRLLSLRCCRALCAIERQANKLSGTHWSAASGMLSISFAVVLFGAAAAAETPLAVGSAAPFAAAPPVLSGSLKSFTAAYSSRILLAIFARWLAPEINMLSTNALPY